METKHLVRAVIGFVLYLFLLPAVLFIAAGTVNWPMAWVYVALLLASSLISRLIVFKRNPETLRERARFTSSEGMKSWDRVLVMIVGLFGPLGIFLVAGFDRRWGWSAAVPLWLQIVAAVAIAAGYGLAVWAMVENRYFSSVVRIQDDRAQEVVSTGAYRFVRHPSYAGALIAGLLLPISLSTLWALIPAAILGAVIVVRTALEDRMLREELSGYADYARRTRYRLVPGLW